jgi:hypothetical protein
LSGLIPAGDRRFTDEFHAFQRSAFRYEGLQVYRGSGEDEWIAAFERGDERPPPDPEQDAWEAMIRAHRAAGRTMSRVHAVIEPLSDYMRFELAWAYPPNIAAGEDIRIWLLSSPNQSLFDYHLFDDERLYLANYADDGTWAGVWQEDRAELVHDARTLRDEMMEFSDPWSSYIQRHPDLLARVVAPVG